MTLEDVCKLDEPWLVSIARTGSTTLPWLDTAHDTDYMIYVSDGTGFQRVRQLSKNKPLDECWIPAILARQELQLYAYQYRFLVPVYGTQFPTYDPLEHVLDYKKLLLEFGITRHLTRDCKRWYHILTGMYLIQNGKYELTEDQIHNVRLCHSRKMTTEIYNWIQSELLSYRKELKQ